MDYITLFGDSDRFSCGLFTLAAYRNGGQNIRLNSRAEYVMIFCLQGSILFRMKYEQTTLKAGELVVINRLKIVRCTCSKGTVLLKYSTAGKLSEYLDKCTEAFQTEVLSPVRILPPLAAWLDTIILKMINDSNGREHSFAIERRELAQLLLAYPLGQLKEIMAPMFACSRLCQVRGACIFHDDEHGPKSNPEPEAGVKVH